MDNEKKINQLIEKMAILLKRQDEFAKEIEELRQGIQLIRNYTPSEETEEMGEKLRTEIPVAAVENLNVPPWETERNDAALAQKMQQLLHTENTKTPLEDIETPKKPSFRPDLEKFIGENLISKIGIIITVIGVGIGAKYSIDNDLISPLTRIILGYLMGLGLLGFGLKLKEKYEKYSAVLVSGAMAIMYFITYAAYDFYHILPQPLAFGLMLLFTVFTVIAALNYNQQIIALIGLVGAYAVPVMLSNNSGRMDIFFAYITIINAGILVIAVRKYWKLLYYAAFVMTWAVFASWLMGNYSPTEDFTVGVTFVTVFFLLFYATFLAYKLVKTEKFDVPSILLLFANSFIFYGLGYWILSFHPVGKQLLGLFTLVNAIIHFAVSLVIYRRKLADKNLLYFVLGLVLVFITIAIPVQLDGNWVTLLWSGEAVLLFWIGRTKGVPFYEGFAYVLMILGVLSLIEDWSAYDSYLIEYAEHRIKPIWNVHFLTGFWVAASFAAIQYLHQNKAYTPWLKGRKIGSALDFMMGAALIGVVYNMFRLEITHYWDLAYADSLLNIKPEGEEYEMTEYNYNLVRFGQTWVLNYTMLFLSVLSFINIKKIKNTQLGWINLAFNAFVTVIFLTGGLALIHELLSEYLNQETQLYYKIGTDYLWIRYISLAFLAGLMWANAAYVRADFMPFSFKKVFELVLFTTLLVVASSELITWMERAHSTQSYKLGLSILWGVYALLVVGFGIWQNKKHLRFAAIVLFALTLVKLFFYDLAHLNTISKTIVLVSLGLLLLVISFLYNKYNYIISDEKENDKI